MANFATRMFASQVGIINFDLAAQDRALFLFAHDLDQIVLEPPNRAIADHDEALSVPARRRCFSAGSEST